MSRYIDADMLRAKLCGWLDCVYQTTEGGQWDDGAGGAIAECVQELDETPTADVATADVAPANRWIPVEERLPENADHLGAFCPKYQVATKFGVTDGWYNPDDKCWYALMWFMTGRFTEDNIDFERGDVPLVCRAGNSLVTHWRSLPEPPEVQK